jgi:hypothetical protein
MDRQQHILHYVVAAIRRDTTPAGYSLDQWNTITQQRFVRRTVTTLRHSHLGRATGRSSTLRVCELAAIIRRRD